MSKESPRPYVPQSALPSQKPVTFTEFKRYINQIDESRFGDALVYVGDDGTCPVVDIAEVSGLPAAPEGSSAARWYGVSPGQAPKILVQFVKLP